MDVQRVAVVVANQVSPFELGVACEVFGTDRTADGIDGWDFAVCSPDAEPVTSWSGFRLTGLSDLDWAKAADLLVVPTCAPRSEPPPEPVLDALRGAAGRGAWVAGFCAGVFSLGYAGLLDGRRCTVHWVYEREFTERFPTAEVDARALYVDDRGVLTSAGTVAAVDLCLHLVRRTRGIAAATALARRMVASPHRAGGQAQFVEAPVLPSDASDTAHAAIIAEVLEWIERRLDQPVTVAELARRAGLRERTFLRRFAAVTGTTPHRWLTERRLDRAQALLEEGRLPVEDVARACGYASAAALRHQFRRLRGTSPSDYRRAFSPEPVAGSVPPTG
ncbi:Transcriptional regulator GlxA family, contains an amidase domain and an AraC-type DNA-binding HTH domain [Amycolatopsis arida]|uniref:Transcriptional regulator GlxA family, contains an amidase domain and an AraC-type DNA-binding HTH domain n=1 Tax=Amycolatopsis arida TaxID=587909 RepID=A0A1I5XY71_9PSEU|nr:helix-turn-helix domain-containing protein [Amycolatopsis arida]TDX97195.1 transcriptional regulator GlxA family with amidase domain [Amycolatopsis arida]SFQ36903.1 Transcriptional regulator GlxA family, contains an amidase domain and an AraC-type DNA-binding HTH domain [Amycolatopsis arida]